MTTSHLASQRCWRTLTLPRCAHPALAMRWRAPAGTGTSMVLSSCTLRSALLHRVVTVLAGKFRGLREVLHMLMRDRVSHGHTTGVWASASYKVSEV